MSRVAIQKPGFKDREEPNFRLVWSSESGRVSPDVKKPSVKRSSGQTVCIPPVDGIVRVRRETKGRGGKTVTVITGIIGSLEEVKKLSCELKRRCGSGGTMKERDIEIQGDHCDLIVSDLISKGFKVKRAGG